MSEVIKNIKGIKNCPFCGNKAEVIKWHDKVYSIACTGLYCSCELGNSTSIQGIKRIWNRRRNEATYPSFKGFTLIKKIKGNWTRQQALKSAECLISTWNDYLLGNVYGYHTEFDSCGGWYGDPKKSGLLDEAKASIDQGIANKIKKHIDRKKIEIKNKVPLEKRLTLTL